MLQLPRCSSEICCESTPIDAPTSKMWPIIGLCNIQYNCSCIWPLQVAASLRRHAGYSRTARKSNHRLHAAQRASRSSSCESLMMIVSRCCELQVQDLADETDVFMEFGHLGKSITFNAQQAVACRLGDTKEDRGIPTASTERRSLQRRVADQAAKGAKNGRRRAHFTRQIASIRCGGCRAADIKRCRRSIGVLGPVGAATAIGDASSDSSLARAAVDVGRLHFATWIATQRFQRFHNHESYHCRHCRHTSTRPSQHGRRRTKKEAGLCVAKRRCRASRRSKVAVQKVAG